MLEPKSKSKLDLNPLKRKPTEDGIFKIVEIYKEKSEDSNKNKEENNTDNLDEVGDKEKEFREE